MSSQDSSTAPPKRNSNGSTKSSKSTAAKKRRRHREPDRLGWLGGPTAERPNSGSQPDEFEFGSQSSSRDITPRPMEFTPPNCNQDAVDLTADGSDDDDDNNKPKQLDEKKYDQWECSQCTLLNTNDQMNCTVCGHRRSSVRKMTSGGITNESKSQSKDDKSNGKRTKSQTADKRKKDTKQSSVKEKSQLWKWTQSQSSQSTKSKKQSAKISTKKQTTTEPSTDLWIDKHFPKTSTDLCIAPKKIEEVRTWLVSHVQARQQRRHATAYRNGSSSGSNSEIQSSLYEAPPSQLMILVGSPGVGKSTLIHVLAKELRLNVLKWNNDVHTDYIASKGEEYVPYQSQLASFEEFLIGVGTGMDSLDEKGGEERFDGSVILIEEIPNLYNQEAAQSFRNVMEKHIQQSKVPTVFIFSDVSEGKHKPEDLERLISNRLLYSLLVQILPIQPVTKAKMKKCIECIAKSEGLGRVPSDFIEELHLSSGGDLRHAIFALQFQYAKKDVSLGSNSITKRDVKLSSFHALGKLLYAKRTPKADDFSDDFPPSPPTSKSKLRLEKWTDDRGHLEFVPEEVLGKTDMNTGSAISFLSYHSPDYFTDITELSRAFDHISDAGSFLDRFGPAEGPYPMDYASSLGGRAIADANKHPAPNQFRHLSAPKVFEVMKKCRDNEVKMDQLRKRLSVGSQQISVSENIGSAHQFVTDSLPYLKYIIPQDVNYALANLHSYARESTVNSSQPDHIKIDLNQQEQEDILKDDDLVDDDNDGW